MDKLQTDITSYVDNYFLQHSYTSHSHTNTTTCPTCSTVRSSQCPKHAQQSITRQDIDYLQLMNPSTTPQNYMDNIMTLYKKQQTLRCRQQKNQPMQLALSTKKIVSSKYTLSSIKQDQQQGQDYISHPQQYKADLKQQQHIRKLRDQCYLGLGKLIITRSEKNNKVELQRANYHTRQYLLPHAQQQMERLQHKANMSNNTKYYVLANANSRGVNFEPEQMPFGLQYIIEPFKYREIICTINEIIQRTVYNHKKSQLTHKHINPLYIWLMIALVILVSLLLLNSLQIHSLGLQMSCLVGSLCLILFILMISCHQFHKELDYIPLLQKIYSGITQYLDYLNSRPGTTLQWSTPNHLYWIQIKVVQSQHKFLGKSYVC